MRSNSRANPSRLNSPPPSEGAGHGIENQRAYILHYIVLSTYGRNAHASQSAEHTASSATPGEASRVNAGSTTRGSSERLPACGAHLLTAISRGGVRACSARSARAALTAEDCCSLPEKESACRRRWESVLARAAGRPHPLPGYPSSAPSRSLPLARVQEETRPAARHGL